MSRVPPARPVILKEENEGLPTSLRYVRAVGANWTRASGGEPRDGKRDGLAQEKGDKQFEELLIPLMDDLYRLACRLERDSDRARDLFQDALLKGFRSFRMLQTSSSFRPWMGRILYRTFLDRHRRNVPEVSIEEQGDLQASLSANPVTEWIDLRSLFLARSTSREIGAALDRLPVDQAVAVFMVDVEEYGYAEAADVLGISPGTVASRVARGRAALRASLHRLARERGWIKP